MAKKEEEIKLTDKQEKFCQEYCIDLNATQAAIRAGYSENTANEIGSQNLAKVSIQNRIAQLREEDQLETKVTRQRVLTEYAKIAFFNPKKLFDESGRLKKITEMDDDVAAVIAGLDVSTMFKKAESEEEFINEVVKKIKHVDKKGALDSLAKHLGMLNDKIDINEKVLINITYSQPE